jgi:hypothetical protein
MAIRVQERSFCSRLWSATCHEARFRWENDKCGLYLFAIGIIICSSFFAMLLHPSFAPCATWSYYATNPALLILGIGVLGAFAPIIGYAGHLIQKVYQKTMHPELMDS